MNIQEFFDLPENVRDELLRQHQKRKKIRASYEDILREEQKLNIRKTNLQNECEHPHKTHKYVAHENEYGNYTGGGTYYYKCPDCGLNWHSDIPLS